MSDWLTNLIGFSITCVFTWFLLSRAPRMGLIDRPDERRPHRGNIPIVGGLAMFFGFAFAALSLDVTLMPLRPLFAASFVLVVVGVFDDLQELSALVRLVAQVIASLIMIYWGGVVLLDLGRILPGGEVLILHGFGVVVTLVASIGVINALNMVDGVDGLAAGLSLVAVVGMAWIAQQSGHGADADVLTLLGCVIAGFWVFNLRLPWQPRARTFMGNAGSLFLGFMLTWYFIQTTQGEGAYMVPVMALYLFAVPLYDTVWLLIRRAAQGHSPFSADYQHLHHLLQMFGFSPGQTTWLILAVAGSYALGAIWALSIGISEASLFALFMLGFGVYCAASFLIWRHGGFLRWRLERRYLTGERRSGSERRESERRSGGERRIESGRREQDSA